MFGLCCCPDDVASCDPGPEPEKAQFVLEITEWAQEPDGPRVPYIVEGPLGNIGIIVPAAEGCEAPDPPSTPGEPNAREGIGDFTYRCRELQTFGPKTLMHRITRTLPDGSRMWDYLGRWVVSNPWFGAPGGFMGPGGLGTGAWSGGLSNSLPIPYAVEVWSYAAFFSIFETYQPLEDWLEQYPCLESLAETSDVMPKCFLTIQLAGTILAASPPGPNHMFWGHVPLTGWYIAMMIYRDHDGQWNACSLHGCCQWDRRTGRIAIHRIDPEPPGAALSMAFAGQARGAE